MTEINFAENGSQENVIAENTEDTRVFTKTEKIYTLITALLGFGFVKLQLSLPKGVFTTVLDILIIAAAIVFLKKKDCKISGINKKIAMILFAFTLVFTITDNSFIKALDSVFIVLGLGYFVYSTANGKEEIDDFFPIAMKHAALQAPVMGKSAYGDAARSAANDSRLLSTIKLVTLGIVITVPLTTIVGGLLISADKGMEHVFSRISMFMPVIFNMKLFWHLLLAIPCTLYFYGMLYANTHRDECKPLSEDECRFAMLKKRIVPNLAAYTAVTPVLLLYVMFFISQGAYFLSAFTGSLPEGYSYAEYARRGFFELCAITVINLALIIFLTVCTKNCGESKPAALKVYTLLLSFSTMILIIVALSKMVMYISVFGLTRLRFYTTWFMVLCAAVFAVIIVRQFRAKMKIAGKLVKLFTVMFAILCFCCPDALIAGYNIAMYDAGYLKQLDKDELAELSADGRLVSIIMLGDDNDMSYYSRMYRGGNAIDIPSIIVDEVFR